MDADGKEWYWSPDRATWIDKDGYYEDGSYRWDDWDGYDDDSYDHSYDDGYDDIDIPIDDYADKMEGFALWVEDRRQDATAPGGDKADYPLMNKVEEMVQDAVTTGHPRPWVVAQDYLDGLGYWPAYWRPTTLTVYLR